MEINYIILAHKNAQQVARLISRLHCENSHFYLHIDKKTDISPFEKELNHFTNVSILEQRISIYWGDISMIDATLIALKKIVSDKRTGYCILMSGQDYPIKSNEYINDFLTMRNGYNFINCIPPEKAWPDQHYCRLNQYNVLPKNDKESWITIKNIYSRYFYNSSYLWNLAKKIIKQNRYLLLRYIFIKRQHPKCLKPYGGSQWWALPMETVIKILNFIDANNNFYSYHKFTFVPDEIFFQSIVVQLIDESLIKGNVTHTEWRRNNGGHPETFETSEDFRKLQESDCLFARKFNEDSSILNKIDIELLCYDNILV